MKELSVFVDESGDFGEYEKHAPYYIITMILHDQSVNISAEIGKLNEALKNMGYGNEQAIHTEPLIRREDPYRYFQPNERRAIFSKLFYFTLGCDIKYKSFVYRKSEYENIFKLEARMARDLSQFIRDNLTYFQSFSKVILYYDNGQHELNRILNTVFATQLVDYDVRKVIPNEYRLFQAADLICTLELLRVKTEHREDGEVILETAKRELKEETGAVEFDIKPICVYSVKGKTRVNENLDNKSFGMLYYANITSFEELHSEIETILITDKLVDHWTYPLIQPKLIEEAHKRGFI